MNLLDETYVYGIIDVIIITHEISAGVSIGHLALILIIIVIRVSLHLLRKRIDS